MKGVVEIWDGDDLLFEEPNMLVDGAGELLADIMTVTPSLSGIQDHATSSILDASNYRIQAISFGTGSYYFNNGARKFDAFKSSLISDIYYPNFIANVLSIIPFVYRPSKALDNYFPNFSNTIDGSSLLIDKATMDQLPTAPNPALKTLEINTNTSALVPTDSGTDVALSSVFPGNGQHCNFLPSAIASAMVEGTPLSGGLSLYIAASLMGAFPDGSSAPYTNALSPARGFYSAGNSANIKLTTNCEGLFNEASSMDVSGFVTNIMSAVANGTYDTSSPASGLILSSVQDSVKLGFENIEYSVLLGAGDLGHVNAYGGIYHLGLWSLDMQKSLENGNSPPYAFSVLNNPRKYKLFCRKGLSKNLCHITDDGEYKDLLLKWRIYFR